MRFPQTPLKAKAPMASEAFQSFPVFLARRGRCAADFRVPVLFFGEEESRHGL